MACHDPIADMLTKIRNALKSKHETVDITASNEKFDIIKILKEEGYIINYKKTRKGNKPIIKVVLSYDESGESVLEGLKRISKPGRRVYRGYKEMLRLYNGVGTVIVSTSRGIVTGKFSRANKVGGEILCAIW